MKKDFWLSMLPVYALVFCGAILLALWGSRAVAVMSEGAPLTDRVCIILDAGHGGEDGGATSCSGVLESNINLEITLRLNDLLHLLGYDTKMIRTTDRSIYTQGETIAAKKVSDLRERVRIANETHNAILVSIHQNYFTDPRYSGAQVFYPETAGSRELATQLQAALVSHTDPQSNRQIKKSHGIYLMDKIQCTAVLVECGFLSNPQEDIRLRSREYQLLLCGILSTTIANYLES